jgi:diketogulonate reductase-like aldo/keto reductase
MNIAMNLVMKDATLEAVERLRPIAEGAGLSMAELALAWVLHRPEVASAIVGASRPEQVHANAKASGIELTADTLAAIDEALEMHRSSSRPWRRWRGPASPTASRTNRLIGVMAAHPGVTEHGRMRSPQIVSAPASARR